MKNSKRNTKETRDAASSSVVKNYPTAIVGILKRGGIGVLPTDTLYGLVGSALRPKAVAKIYRLRKRNPKKPLIVLISSLSDLKRFNIRLNSAFYFLLSNSWPGKISVTLPCSSPKFRYIHRGTKSIAFRLPAKKSLRALLRKTGPLVAPSANFEGKPPAKTISEAKKNFGDKIDFYINTGPLRSQPSTLIAITNGGIKILRKGAGLNQRITNLFRIYE